MPTKQRRVIVSVINDLVTDQRVHRSCTALCDAGYSVTLVGRRLADSGPLNRNYKTVRMRLLFRKKAVFYAEYNIRLFLRLIFSKADIFYSNDTDTLLANYYAAKIRGKLLFFDAHEMFPEVPELVGRNGVKRFWMGIENHIFPKIQKMKPRAAAVTVCRSIADIYMERYRLEMGVVRNVPMRYETECVECGDFAKVFPSDKKILLYQGAVNVGRGLEWVIDAMPHLPQCHLVIAGVGDVYDALVKDVERRSLEGCVTFLGRVEPSVLHHITPLADLGLSLLENRGLNYYYSLPNRIADFVQSGVPVLATDFPEIHRVVEEYGIGSLVPSFERRTENIEGGTDSSDIKQMSLKDVEYSPEVLARYISEALAYWEQIPREERENKFKKASEELSWEHDKEVLLECVNRLSM